MYLYGKPAEDDKEGIYRSTDAGKTWVCINTDHLYGGTGNGNFLVGDMNTFGKVYMSTVGCGIVVGEIGGSEQQPVVTTTTTTKPVITTTTTVAGSSDTVWGDVDCNGKVAIADVVMLSRYINEDKVTVTKQGLANAAVTGAKTLGTEDVTKILQYIARLIDTLAP